MSGILQGLIGSLKSAASSTTDAFFNLVTLLLNTTATNGAQNNTFLDSSTNNFSITRNGNTTQGTFTPFSQTGWSNYMTTGYLTTASNAGFALSGDFTVECWVFSGDSSLDGSTRRRLFHTGGGDISNSLQLLLGTSGGNSAVISVLNNGFLIDGSINVVTNSWVHIAVTRSGTSLKLFVNGVQSGSTATTSQNFNSGSSNTVYIGANSDGAGIWQGYVSNLRILNGTAAYTSAFTPPTAPFATGTTNQQLLVCASNRFADINTATSAKTITVVSTPSVQAFSPFLPTIEYDAAVVGGSGYFDGSDYLNFTDSSNLLDMGGAVTSLEGFFYPTGTSSAQCLVAKGGGSGSWSTSSGFEWQLTYSSSKFDFTFNNAGSPANLASATVPINQWYYVAVATDASSNISLYLNGTRVATSTNAITKPTSRTLMYLGQDVSGSYFTGYMSGVRFIGGSGAYNPTSTTITVPTAPPTAITNTKLLTNFTNSGIFDSAAKNVLETVGNAQVSTTQAKWGTTSMYFDGTGDNLFGKSTDLLSFGTGDFTIEMWVNPASIPAADKVLIDTRASGSDSGYTPYINNGTLKMYSGAADRITSTSNISANVWTHIAFVRSSGTMAVYINGTQSGTATYTGSITCPGNIFIGSGFDGAANFNGYIDDLRITKGYARYTSSFTAPTAAFPLQ